MTTALRSVVREHLLSTVFPNTSDGRLAKVKDAVALLINAPEYLIQQ
jgi:hypothetical protein